MLLSCHWFPLPSTCFCTSLNQSICSCSRHDCSVSMLRLSSAGCELSVESREPRERCLIFSWLVDVDCVCMLSEVVETRECFPTMTIERSFTSVLPTKVAREEEWGKRQCQRFSFEEAHHSTLHLRGLFSSFPSRKGDCTSPLLFLFQSALSSLSPSLCYPPFPRNLLAPNLGEQRVSTRALDLRR